MNATKVTESSTLRIKKICTQHRLSSMELVKLYMNDIYKYVYCFTNKVASTSWRCVLKRLHIKNACEPGISVKTWQQQTKRLLQPSDLYNSSEVQMRLKKYYKFMFVREPLERLVSAYRMYCVSSSNNWVAKEVQKHRKHRKKGNTRWTKVKEVPSATTYRTITSATASTLCQLKFCALLRNCTKCH